MDETNLDEKISLFPWLKTVHENLQASFGLGKVHLLQEAISKMVKSSNSEIKRITETKDHSRGESLLAILCDYVVYFHLQEILHNKWDNCIKSAILKVLSCLLDLAIFLSQGDPQSAFISKAVNNIKLCLKENVPYLWDVLLHCKHIKKNNAEVCCPFLKLFLIRPWKQTLTAQEYVKYILLLRIWRMCTLDVNEKRRTVKLALRMEVDENIAPYLKSLWGSNTFEIDMTSSKEDITKWFLCKKYPPGLFNSIKKALCEDLPSDEVVKENILSGDNDKLEKEEVIGYNIIPADLPAVEGFKEHNGASDTEDFYFDTNGPAEVHIKKSSKKRRKAKKKNPAAVDNAVVAEDSATDSQDASHKKLKDNMDSEMENKVENISCVEEVPVSELEDAVNPCQENNGNESNFNNLNLMNEVAENSVEIHCSSTTVSKVDSQKSLYKISDKHSYDSIEDGSKIDENDYIEGPHSDDTAMEISDEIENTNVPTTEERMETNHDIPDLAQSEVPADSNAQVMSGMTVVSDSSEDDEENKSRNLQLADHSKTKRISSEINKEKDSELFLNSESNSSDKLSTFANQEDSDFSNTHNDSTEHKSKNHENTDESKQNKHHSPMKRLSAAFKPRSPLNVDHCNSVKSPNKTEISRKLFISEENQALSEVSKQTDKSESIAELSPQSEAEKEASIEVSVNGAGTIPSSLSKVPCLSNRVKQLKLELSPRLAPSLRRSPRKKRPENEEATGISIKQNKIATVKKIENADEKKDNSEPKSTKAKVQPAKPKTNGQAKITDFMNGDSETQVETRKKEELSTKKQGYNLRLR